MARQKRYWYEGAICHVMSRGNKKAPIFHNRHDYVVFLKQVIKAKEKYRFTVHSICLMTNHFHMEIETEDISIGTIMRKILTPYAIYFNETYDSTGHVFGGRYKSTIVEGESSFLEVSRYIHLNPVKAQMVSDPADYPYSSYRLYTSERKPREYTLDGLISKIVDTSKILEASGNDREAYKLFVEDKISHDEQEKLIMKGMNEDELWQPR